MTAVILDQPVIQHHCDENCLVQIWMTHDSGYRVVVKLRKCFKVLFLSIVITVLSVNEMSHFKIKCEDTLFLRRKRKVKSVN